MNKSVLCLAPCLGLIMPMTLNLCPSLLPLSRHQSRASVHLYTWLL